LGCPAGTTTERRQRTKVWEREVHDLRPANCIVREAPAHFAMAQLDHRSKSSSRYATIVARPSR
jgi:hypothetical protein